MRIHGPSSPQPSGCQDCCTLRNTRSGCGMRMVKRPSAVVRPVMPSRRTVGVERIGLGRRAAVVDEAQRDQRLRLRAAAGRTRARPSPCAVAIGMRLPAMPAKNSDGLSATSTMTKRASNCSERFRRNFGQCAAPGMISRRLLIIWQPLQTPSANASPRPKKASNSSRARAIEQDRLGPALARAEHVAVGEAAAGGEALEVARATRARR